MAIDLCKQSTERSVLLLLTAGFRCNQERSLSNCARWIIPLSGDWFFSIDYLFPFLPFRYYVFWSFEFNKSQSCNSSQDIRRISDRLMVGLIHDGPCVPWMKMINDALANGQSSPLWLCVFCLLGHDCTDLLHVCQLIDRKMEMKIDPLTVSETVCASKRCRWGYLWCDYSIRWLIDGWMDHCIVLSFCACNWLQSISII